MGEKISKVVEVSPQIKKVYRRRITDIQNFVASGDKAWVITVDEDENVQHVYCSYLHVLKTRPYLGGRTLMFYRQNMIFLVRKE